MLHCSTATIMWSQPTPPAAYLLHAWSVVWQAKFGALLASASPFVSALEVLKRKSLGILCWQVLLGVPGAGPEALEPAIARKALTRWHVVRRVHLQ